MAGSTIAGDAVPLTLGGLGVRHSPFVGHAVPLTRFACAPGKLGSAAPPRQAEEPNAPISQRGRAWILLAAVA
jgi:hypothetical protein